MKSKSQKPAQPVEIARMGGDEMNLVEYPFASLWNKEAPGVKIEHEWETQHPITGRTVRAVWRAEGSPELGLPGPSEERLYLALMELSREQGFAQVVAFTRHDLVKRLDWPHNQHSYRMVTEGFRRLKAVSITSENAFWDASIKSFRTVGFGIVDNYDIVAEPPGRKKKGREQGELPLSYFRWNDVIFGSVQAGYIRSLDVGFGLSLRGDLALRLFRYLDKKAYDGRPHFEIELASLCDRHLGMKPTNYDSTRRARLRAAHEELLARGFLQSVEFAPMKTRKAEKVRYAFSPRRDSARALAAAPASQPPPHQPEDAVLGHLSSHNADVVLLDASSQEASSQEAVQKAVAREAVARMMTLGVSPEVAQSFVAEVPPEELSLQLDCLPDRNAKDAAAVFVKSVREKWAVPQAHLDRVEARQRAQRQREGRETARVAKARHETERQEQSASQEEERARLDQVWEQLDEAQRQELDREASQRLGVLGRSGKAQGALMAMRRNLLRERLTAQLSLQPQEPPTRKSRL